MMFIRLERLYEIEIVHCYVIIYNEVDIIQKEIDNILAIVIFNNYS